jgi:hypothetical protein
MEETTRGAAATPGESGDYEAPQVFDLGSVFEVTLGSSTGGADSNGQGLY